MIFVIYKLIDPRSGDVRYVGQTSNGLEVRLKQHVKNPCSKKMKAWVNELSSMETEPTAEVIEGGLRSYKKANEREQYWIEHYRSNGLLLNSKSSPRSSKKWRWTN